jgi:hypothetical protein
MYRRKDAAAKRERWYNTRIANEEDEMLRTTIQTTDEAGKELPIPPDLLSKVRRAAELLGSELGEVAEKFDIESKWWFVPARNGAFEVKFDLTTKNLTRTQNVGLMSSTLPADALADDDSILRALRPRLSQFARSLSGIVKEEFERIRRELQALATVTGE